MGERAEYRSAIRSRRLIREAFLSIIQERGISKITVTEIVKRADINRATFYAHFPDVQGIVDEMENEVIGKIFDLLRPGGHGNFLDDLPMLFKNINTYIGENIDSFRILVKVNESLTFIEKMKKILVDFMLEYDGIPESVRSGEQYHLSCIYFVGGVMSLYKSWLMGEVDCTLEMIAAQCEPMLRIFTSEYIDK